MQRDSTSCTNKDLMSKNLPHTWWNSSTLLRTLWKTSRFHSIISKLKGRNTWIMITIITAIPLVIVEQITLNLWRPFSWIHGCRFVTILNSNLIKTIASEKFSRYWDLNVAAQKITSFVKGCWLLRKNGDTWWLFSSFHRTRKTPKCENFCAVAIFLSSSRYCCWWDTSVCWSKFPPVRDSTKNNGKNLLKPK